MSEMANGLPTTAVTPPPSDEDFAAIPAGYEDTVDMALLGRVVTSADTGVQDSWWQQRLGYIAPNPGFVSLYS